MRVVDLRRFYRDKLRALIWKRCHSIAITRSSFAMN
jgi:hypothetical protein